MFNILSATQPVNPVGEVRAIPEVAQYVLDTQGAWDQVKATSSSWWKIWKKVSLAQLQQCSKFLLLAVDDLIQLVDNLIDNGPDKKATVLDAMSKIYDYVVAEALPLWIKPFAASVKNYIVYSLLSSAIDFFVDKYRHGAWRDKIGVPADPTPAPVETVPEIPVEKTVVKRGRKKKKK